MGFNGTAGTPGSWPGIRFRSGGYASQSVMKKVQIYDAGTVTEGAIYVDRVSPTLENVSVRRSAGPGFLINGSSQTFKTLTAEDCLGDGIAITGASANPLIGTSSVTRNNGGNGIDLRAGAKVRIGGVTSSNNAGWAVEGDPDTGVSSLATFTMTGNGGGAKNAFGTRGGTTSVSNVTWTFFPTLPRYVTGLVTVPAGKTLTIPAQTVRFEPGAALEIPGKLLATGTAAAPIILTSAAATPAPGDWDGVRFHSTTPTTSTLTHTKILYATTGLLLDGYGGTLTNTTVGWSSVDGIKVQGTPARPTLNTAAVSSTVGDAIYLAGGAGAIVNNPVFSANQGYAFSVDKATSLLTVTGVTPPSSGGDFNNAIRMRATSITADEAWLLPPLPWVVTADLTIQNGKTVTIPAGTTIRFAPETELFAQGTLIANGTAAQPVRLTSNQSVPAAGDWGGLSIGYLSYYTVSATLTNTIVEYAGRTTGARPAVSFSSCTPVIDALTVQASYGDGISASDSFVTGSRLAVLGSAARSIRVDDVASRITLPHSRFEGNAQGIQFNTGTPMVDLRLSYWGAASGPSGAGPGAGELVPAGLQYEPWLVAAPSSVNYFTSVTAKNRMFNPAIGVLAHIDHTEQLASSWTLNVYSGTSLIRTMTGTNAFVDWDGRDAGGALQPDGAYRWELAASAAGGNATPASGLAILDSTKDELIPAFALSERYFSPNGDGAKETTTASAAIAFSDSSWTLKFKNAGGSVVRTTSGLGAFPDVAWNGKDDGGILQPEGAYVAELTVTNFAASASKTAPVDIDRTPPTAAISTPIEGAVASNIYALGTSVHATAQDARLSGWTLRVGAGIPYSWTGVVVLASGSTPLSDDEAAVWGSTSLAVGQYTLQLIVTDLAGNQTTVDRHVWKRDFSVSQTNSSGDSVWEFDPDTLPMPYQSVIPFSLRETIIISDEPNCNDPLSPCVVRTLVNNELRAAGTWRDYWNGMDDAGQRVPDGAYFYTASVTDGAVTYGWDRYASSRSQKLTLRSSTSDDFAPYDNIPLEVDYELASAQNVIFQAASVPLGTVFASCGSLPQEARCLEQHYRPSGTHKIYWAGTDAAGLPFTSAQSIRIGAERFPENATVLYGSEPQVGIIEVVPPLLNPAAGANVRFPLTLRSTATARVDVSLIRHENGATVRTMSVPGLAGGNVQVFLDGHTDNGLWIPDGNYSVAITITDSIGNVVTRHALMTARY
jgi:flagellar hook assembly protein FlgD/urease beta subunit